MIQISSLGTAAAKDITTDYLNLLVEQLKHQNPLEPMDSSDMSAQLAQLSQLQQTEDMNKKFDDLLESVQLSQAAALVGKSVAFETDDDSAAPGTGQIDSVEFEQGRTILRVGTQAVEPSRILALGE